MDEMGNKVSLVVGLGFGNLYVDVLKKMGHRVVTVDGNPERQADYTDLKDALDFKLDYDTVHICTPNHTHEQLAKLASMNARVVMVEKPGVESAQAWHNMAQQNGQMKIVMTKNNQLRHIWPQLRSVIRSNPPKTIRINWINKNRVPQPGSWFTDKSKAFGGVSRDLMPHLLSMVCVLFPEDWHLLKLKKRILKQKHTLAKLTDTDYGVVNAEGVYDVDDYCQLKYQHPTKNIDIILTADWKSDEEDDIAIHFDHSGKTTSTPLGLCPESCYRKMIEQVIQMDGYYDQPFWDEQFCQDVWIHEQVTGTMIENTRGYGESVFTVKMDRQDG